MISAGMGLAEIIIGGTVVGGGSAATVGTGGAASPASVPAVAAGVTAIAHGSGVISTALQGYGRMESSSAGSNSGKSEAEKSTKPTNQTAAGQTTNARRQKLGPSGKPQVNVIRHSTRKQAKDAARNEGKSKPTNHRSPQKGDDHYHSTDKKGEKIDGSTHHEY